MKKKLFYAGIVFVLFTGCAKVKNQTVEQPAGHNDGKLKTTLMTFVHPGTVLTKPQLQYAYAQAIANVEPWKTTFANFQSNYASFLSSAYTAHAHAQVGRNLYKADYENDAMAMFVNGVMWNMTGQSQYADKVVQLLDAWTSTCTSIQYPDNDWQLCNGYGLHFMIYGADLIYNYPGFTSVKKTNAKNLFTIFYNYYATYATANGKTNPFVVSGWPSWGSSAGKFIMAYGIFCENQTAYDLSLEYFSRTAANGADNGTNVTAFLSTGQPVECGRDQYYAQLNLASFLEWAQMAYNQGSTALYDARSGVIGKAMEYVAKYNLGNSVTWTSVTPATPIWAVTPPITAISTANRGNYRPIWYMAYNYYHRYRGLSMPYTEQVIGSHVNEGQTATITDEVGYGSLFYCNSSQTVVAPPYTW
ncbi:Alginate lyase [Mucilaginibacter gossypiicola]|uniref:Alginate lyase n=1 Tax=Mucilaginibacter gossypiicola TaxID=551995 RepID=A0A1H8LQJ2_9SPHI|nr:alginate lyase family protein [Mucilaginibacter gossypiicola]SEO07086.1 Alginate lyase [Mucilaginibacter gossypiicola]